jgi:hypothetical protein
MSNETLLQILGGLAAFLLFALAWRRFDIGEMSMTSTSSSAEEPCWTEAERREDGLSYGRYGCYHEQLHEMEVRARRGDFNTPV